MGKKAVKKKTVSEPGDKVRLELRFDADVAEMTKALAERAGISVNQLLAGLARWGVKNLRCGEPLYDAGGRVSARPQPGCLWAGREAGYVAMTDQEIAEYAHECGGSPPPGDSLMKPDDSKYGKGEVYAFLDFTERRVVRDDLGPR